MEDNSNVQNLIAAVESFLSLREETLSRLRELKQALEAEHNTMRKVTVAGSSLSILGSVAAIVGLALAPATLGGSLTLSVIGGVVAASGGAATVGASVSGLRRGQSGLKTALEVLEKDQSEYTKMVALSEQLFQSTKLTTPPGSAVDSAGGAAGELKAVGSNVLQVVDAFKGVAVAAAGVGRGFGVAASSVVKVFKVGAVVSMVTIPFDIVVIARAFYDIKKYDRGNGTSNCDSAEDIGKLIADLEANKDNVLRFCQLLKEQSTPQS